MADPITGVAAGSISKVDYVVVTDRNPEGIDLSTTDLCLRFAIPQRPSQGIGWSFYDDVNEGVATGCFPFPEGRVGACEILDENDERIQLVMDSRSFETYRLGKIDEWIDGVGEYRAGAEIESEVIWPEAIPPVQASAKLRHTQSHLYMRPWEKG